MTVLLVLPLVVPLATAGVSLLAWRAPRLQRWLGMAGLTVLLGAALALLHAVRVGGVAAVQIGGWPAPFGITIVADLLSAVMVAVAALVGFAVGVYSLATIDPRREAFGYHPVTHVMLMGVCGAFLTGDVFNLYVWFEVLLIGSFVLLVLGGERAQLEGATKYVTLNLVASAVLLTGVGILYATTGTLNMAALRGAAASAPPATMTAIAILFLVAFGIKAAVFPLFFWLPASYHTPPAAVSAIFAGLLTKVGVYGLIRVFTLVFVGDVGYTHAILAWIAGLTMVTGVLGAVAQGEVRRILAFHIVSQIGYMLMGLALFTPLGLAGSIYYVVHHIVVKTNLFLVGGLVERLGGGGALAPLGGLYRRRPVLAALFLVPALSLAGMPPLSGFFAKLALVQAGFLAAQPALVATALAVGLLTLYSMTKIWSEAFWKEPPDAAPPGPSRAPGGRVALYGPSVLLATVTVLLGLGAGPAFRVAEEAAAQLLEPHAYVAAVLGGP
jgi:multicomponent Na+:H+ antiporter subunit D